MKKVNTMLLHLGSFVLSNGKPNVNILERATNGFKSQYLYFRDTDILYNEIKPRNKLNELGSIGKCVLQEKNDYKHWSFFYCLLSPPKKIFFNYS